MDTLNLAHSIITDADEICDMVAVWDLSMSDAVFTSVIYYMLKDFPPWSTFAKNRRTAWKYGEWKMSLPSFPPVIFRLFSRVMSPNYEWKSQQSLYDHGFLSTFWGHNEISSWTVVWANRSCSNSNRYWRRSFKEPKVRDCVYFVTSVHFLILFLVY